MSALLPLAVVCDERGQINLVVPTGDVVELPDTIIVELVSVWSTQQSPN